MPDTPLRPDELATYKTDVATRAEERDDDLATPGEDARPWMAFGLALAGIFALTLLLAILIAIR